MEDHARHTLLPHYEEELNMTDTLKTRREILRAAECMKCGFMIPAPGTIIPIEQDVSCYQNLSRSARGPSAISGRCASGCVSKGGRTVSLVDGRLVYTPQ